MGRLFRSPALRRTLLVCTTLQMCQQLSGINAIVYFTPQILREAGAPAMFAGLGWSDAAALTLTLAP